MFFCLYEVVVMSIGVLFLSFLLGHGWFFCKLVVFLKTHLPYLWNLLAYYFQFGSKSNEFICKTF